MADLPAAERAIARCAYVPQFLKSLLTAHLIGLESATLATVPDSVGLGGSTPSPLAHWKVNSWVRREDVFVARVCAQRARVTITSGAGLTVGAVRTSL